jgi:sulfide:quinone oxidoreductase
MRVEEAPRVFAAGDATWFPIKQGGLAAQQADVAAESIAALAAGRRPTIFFRPVLRAALLTGGAPRFLRAQVGDSGTAAAGAAPLWWPPAKVAARHLAPYLRDLGGITPEPTAFEDLEPVAAEDQAAVEAEHRELVELALSFAEADARWGDLPAALRWLAIAESVDVALPPEYVSKRERWEKELNASR